MRSRRHHRAMSIAGRENPKHQSLHSLHFSQSFSQSNPCIKVRHISLFPITTRVFLPTVKTVLPRFRLRGNRTAPRDCCLIYVLTLRLRGTASCHPLSSVPYLASNASRWHARRELDRSVTLRGDCVHIRTTFYRGYQSHSSLCLPDCLRLQEALGWGRARNGRALYVARSALSCPRQFRRHP